jgi:Zn-finger nucleic acid-binding protein
MMVAIAHDVEARMNCPRCRTALAARSIEGIEIDECRACQGIWFDADELRRVKDVTDPDLKWMDVDLWQHPDRFGASDTQTVCPKCAAPLATVGYEGTDVEIDLCPACRGIWLDSGELEKIIDDLAHSLLTKGASDYVRASLEEAKELVTGSEGFLSEWRDFTTVLRMLQYRLLSENPVLGRALTDVQNRSPF